MMRNIFDENQFNKAAWFHIGPRQYGQLLTHCRRVTHICISKISITSWDNGLSPGRHEVIIWTNDEILLSGPLRMNPNESVVIQENPFQNVWKMAAILSRSHSLNRYTAAWAWILKSIKIIVFCRWSTAARCLHASYIIPNKNYILRIWFRYYLLTHNNLKSCIISALIEKYRCVFSRINTNIVTSRWFHAG